MAEIYVPGQEELGRRRFPDNKGFRQKLYTSSINKLGQIQGLLPSNYPDDFSTNAAIWNRVMAREFARLNCDMDFLSDDKQYTTTRIRFLQQILGERLFLGKQIAPPLYNDKSYREYLIAIKDAYLRGSTVESLEELASQFTGQEVNIRELYLEARQPDSSLDVSDTHMMVVDVMVADALRAGYNINMLKQELDFFINLTKPAHTLYDTRLIWTETIIVNKIHDIIFGDTGGGCVPLYIFDDFEEPTILAQQIFIVAGDSENITGQIDSIHAEDLVFYLTDGTRVIFEPGVNGTRIFKDGKRVSFYELEIGQYLRLNSQNVPGDFTFWWYPSEILPTPYSQFYKDIYRLPLFQETVKKEMDQNGRFPLQIRTTPTTVCDRWVQDLLVPYYEDTRHACTDSYVKDSTYSDTLNERMGQPHLSWPYPTSEIHDSVLLGNDFIYFMGHTPLTDGSSNPAAPTDVSVILDGTALPGQPVVSVDASTGRVTMTDSSVYWDESTNPYPVAGDEFVFSYKYLEDGTNYDTTSAQVYGISYWQMPHAPLVADSSGTLAGTEDVNVSIDGTEVSGSVSDIRSLMGHIILDPTSDYWNSSELGRIPALGDSIQFDYKYSQNNTYSEIFDTYGRVTDQYGSNTSYSIVHDVPDSTNLSESFPDDSTSMIGYRYRMYQLHHSSVLNSPDTLQLNNFQKPANRASIINQADTINHFNVVWSAEFLDDTSNDIILDDQYLSNGLDPVVKLNEGTPTFQETWGYHEGLVYQDKLQDIRKNHKLLMYSDLLLKEFPEGGDADLSSICDSNQVRFKIRIGEDTIPPISECPPWILFDTVQISTQEVSIPGSLVGVPNLRVPDKGLRDNITLRELEASGTGVVTYTEETPFNEEPPTEFNLPETFRLFYEGDYLDFPSLPVVDEDGNLATIADISATIDGTSWTVIGLDPVTGWAELDSYPEYTIIERQYTITEQDAAQNRIDVEGWITDPGGVTVTPIHGTAQYLNEDFVIDGRYITWLGGPLDGLFSAGDEVRISYTIMPFLDSDVVFTYRIRNNALLPVMNKEWSRITDSDDVMAGYCYDGYKTEIGIEFDEYMAALDDYSDGIKIPFFNPSTLQYEEHVFSGPVFETYDIRDDELGDPDNFPNALVRLRSSNDNPLTYQGDYSYMGDKVVRFRKKMFRELLPSKTFRVLELMEMLPV